MIHVIGGLLSRDELVELKVVGGCGSIFVVEIVSRGSSSDGCTGTCTLGRGGPLGDGRMMLGGDDLVFGRVAVPDGWI